MSTIHNPDKYFAQLGVKVEKAVMRDAPLIIGNELVKAFKKTFPRAANRLKIFFMYLWFLRIHARGVDSKELKPVLFPPKKMMPGDRTSSGIGLLK